MGLHVLHCRVRNSLQAVLIQGELGVVSGEHFIEECIQSLCQTACDILMGTKNLSGGVWLFMVALMGSLGCLCI